METLNGSWGWKKYRFHWLGGKNWEARYRITATTRSCSRNCYIRRPFKALKSPMQSRMGITAVTFLVGIIPIYVRLEIVPSFFSFLNETRSRNRFVYRLASLIMNHRHEAVSCEARFCGSSLFLIFLLSIQIETNGYSFAKEGTWARSRDERGMKKDSLNRFLCPFKTSLSSPLLVQRIYSADYFAFLGPPLIVLLDKKEGEGGVREGTKGEMDGEEKREKRKKEQSKRRCTTTSSAISAYLCR